jgi:nucleotide-binding universal stress UspA family protein
VFSTIICATDGPPHADRALAYAKWLASEEDARLVVVHAYRTVMAYGGHETERPQLERVLRELVFEMRADGVDAVLEVVPVGTSVARTIAHVAKEVAADLIIVATHGHSPIAGMLLGSVSQLLLRVAPCPVLAVPEAARAPTATDGVGVGTV